MAMRPTGGRAGQPWPRFIVGRIYEPFKPMSEEPPFTKPKQQQQTTVQKPKSEEPPFTKPKQQQQQQKPEDSKERATSSNAAVESEKKPLEGGTSSSLIPSESQAMPTKQEPLRSVGKEADGEFRFGSLGVPKDDDVEKRNEKGKSKIEEKKMGLESRKGEFKGGNGWMKEDRKTVMNMGVGVLVIVALGIHVSYTIGLIRKGE